MSKWSMPASVAILIIFASSARPQLTLGAVLKQGRQGHPIVSEIIQPGGGKITLATFLQLRKDDEIVVAHSDPILLSDGQLHNSWYVNSINDLLWVLQRTRSTIGVTVKREKNFIRTIAIYRVKTGKVYGPECVQVGVWMLEGPETVERP
jgi:hypothetical protein